MSAESGISTFRDGNGLWDNYRVEDVATPAAWQKNPELVQKFYNDRRKQVLSAEPNACHLFIKELEDEYNVTIVTQNIDDLHERAGSTKVVHLHGNITLAKSSGPFPEKKYYPVHGWEIKMTDTCDDGYPLRPHVVWFGENVPMLAKAGAIVNSADILVVIGTSLQVYPAAGLIDVCKRDCVKIIVDPSADTLVGMELEPIGRWNADEGDEKKFITIVGKAAESVEQLRTQLNKLKDGTK